MAEVLLLNLGALACLLANARVNEACSRCRRQVHMWGHSRVPYRFIVSPRSSKPSCARPSARPKRRLTTQNPKRGAPQV